MAECWLGVVDWDKNYENVLDYAKGVNHFQRIYNHMNLHLVERTFCYPVF